jgi:hypothetical protein
MITNPAKKNGYWNPFTKNQVKANNGNIIPPPLIVT